jgi:hypothetical protein
MTERGSSPEADDGYVFYAEPTSLLSATMPSSSEFAELPDGTILRPVLIEGPRLDGSVGPTLTYDHPGLPEGTKFYIDGQLAWKVVRRPKRRAAESSPIRPSSDDLAEGQMRELAARKGYTLKRVNEGTAIESSEDYEFVEPDGNTNLVYEDDFSVIWSYLKSLPDKRT